MLQVIRPDMGEENGKEDDDQNSERYINEKYPVPPERIGNIPAQRRADDRRKSENRAHESLVFASFRRWENIPDDGKSVSHHYTGADALDAAENNDLVHGVTEPASDRSEDEYGNAAHIKIFPAVEVGYLASDGDGDSGKNDIGGGHPGVFAKAAQIADDTGQGGTYNSLIERAKKHGQHDAGKRNDDLFAGQRAKSERLNMIIVCHWDSL